MKVTFASYHTISLKHGGPLSQALQTKKYLEKMGIDVHLFNPWDSIDKYKESDLFHLFASNFANYDLAMYLNEFKKKYVVSSIFYTRRSAKTVKSVCKIQSGVNKLVRGTMHSYGFNRDICNWAEHILPNTTKEGDLIRNSFDIPESKITMVPNGVEDRFLSANPDLFYKKYGLKDFIIYVGHVGVQRKNTLALMKALRNINHPAVIIGKVSNTKEAEECLREAQKNPNILLIDGLDHEDPMLASAYAASSVFALPALFETPGIAALEAAITGSKVVITPHGGTQDYFGNMAEYVDPYNTESIAKGIEKALNDKSDNGLKKHVEQNFLWQKVAEKTAAIYEKVLKEE